MRRSGVGLSEVADWHNLAAAFHRAAKGATDGPVIQGFRENLAAELSDLRRGLLTGTLSLGEMTAFRIHDPKPRLIHAPCFRERVLHHAVMAQVGPVLDNALVDDTYACRTGKGALAAVRRCQQHARRYPWYVQIDIRGFFASIDHGVLLACLRRKLKNQQLLELLGRIVRVYETRPGKGLPIGALTSQHFANFYLAGLDRLLSEDPRVRGMVRYMDDLAWWTDDREKARETLTSAAAYAEESLALTVKSPPRLGRSRHGLCFCGYRILPGALLLSRRRKRRYAERRRHWEQAYAAGRIDGYTLQRNYAAVLGQTSHADARAWRAEQLRRQPLAGRLYEL